MAHSLSMEVTHVASYLDKFKRFCLKMNEKSAKAFEEITNLDPEAEHYNDKIRKVVKDFDKEFEEDWEHQNDEFKLFIEDISDVAKHSSDEYVIYSLKSYAAIERELKDIRQKKFKKLMETIEDSRMYAKADNDYVLALAYANILNNIKKNDDRLEQTITKLNKITKLKEDDD